MESYSGKIILIGGGVRSGKSAFALQRAAEFGLPMGLLATAEARDEEMRERIRRHQEERGSAIETIEEPFDLVGALQRFESAEVIVLDCLTLWVSNVLHRVEAEFESTGFEVVEKNLLGQLDVFCDVIEASHFCVLIVTNEVGMGLVPESKLGRLYRDLMGRVHQRLGERAAEVYTAMLGTMLRLKPDPIERVEVVEKGMP